MWCCWTAMESQLVDFGILFLIECRGCEMSWYLLGMCKMPCLKISKTHFKLVWWPLEETFQVFLLFFCMIAICCHQWQLERWISTFLRIQIAEDRNCVEQNWCLEHDVVSIRYFSNFCSGQQLVLFKMMLNFRLLNFLQFAFHDFYTPVWPVDSSFFVV